MATAERAQVNQQRVLDSFLELVQIDSPSGHEAALAARLEEELRRCGLEVEKDSTGNLIARSAGRGVLQGAAPLLLCAHMDTVQGTTSVTPRLEGGLIRSNGTTILAADDKAGIAAILEALQTAHERSLDLRPLEVVLTVEEETGLTGAKNLDLGRLRSKQGVVLDSHGPAGTMVNRGPAQNSLAAVITGKAAHAGVSPELGINAIQAAAKGIAEMKLGRIDDETTANVGVISGGTATNIVPERVELKGEARSRDERKLLRQTDHMVQALQSGAAAVGAVAEIKVTRSYGAINIAESSSLVLRIREAAQTLGLPACLESTGGGSDANILNAAGIETVNLGVGYEHPHSVEEQIAVVDLARSAALVLALITT